VAIYDTYVSYDQINAVFKKELAQSGRLFHIVAYTPVKKANRVVSPFILVTNITGNYHVFAVNWRCPFEKIG
jgi:hypothetical protein